MRLFLLHKSPDGEDRLDVPFRGSWLLHHPLYNKGSAFTDDERHIFGLGGMLPGRCASMEEQVERVWENLARTDDPLQKYILLASLQDRNEHLFFRVLHDYLEELLPIVYTPTVGKACQEYSHIFRRGRGLWITPDHRGEIERVLGHAPFRDVRLIVVTDNERILGLGDQGAGGMGIPIGKLALYTTAAGIHPSLTLPISLDVGTDNQALLDDPMYLGYRKPRLRGEGYLSLVDELVAAVKKVFPGALLQWEDFKKANAFRLLDRHRESVLSFNDDIEGTAAVAVAGLMSAARVTGIPISRQRVVIGGAGAAGIGIARQIRATLLREGVSDRDALAAIALVDSRGFLVASDTPIDAHKRDFCWSRELASAHGLTAGDDLETVVRALEPHALVGTTGVPGYFSEAVVREMARHVDRPVVLPFSNPTSMCEATPADILRWTDGRALVATGSPFDPVRCSGRTHRIGQGNNAFVFPGVGLGLLVAKATRVCDAMFAAAAEALAHQVSEADLAAGSLYPKVGEMRRVSRSIAVAVARVAREQGTGAAMDDEAIERAVDAFVWQPRYPRFIPC